MNPQDLTKTVKAGAILGFLAMSVLGWNLAGTQRQAGSDVSINEEVRKSSRDPRRGRSSGVDPHVKTRLDAIRTAGSPEARLRATFDLANSLSVQEIVEWYDRGMFTLRGGPERLLFRNILLARWRQEDPESLLAWSIKNKTSNGNDILTAWSENEPQRLVDFFKAHPDESAELRSLRNIAKIRPELALQRLQEMAAEGISMDGASGTFGLFSRLAEKSPGNLEAALDILPANLREEAEAALSGQRLAASFGTEVRALWDRADGWNVFEKSVSNDSKLQANLFDELANMPPDWKASVASNYYYFMRGNNITKWLDSDLEGMGFTAVQSNKLRTKALESLARNKPEDAVSRMAGMELNTKDRERLISNMISAVSSDSDKAESLVGKLEPGEDQEFARNALEARINSRSAAKTTNPAEWLEKVSSVDPKFTNDSYRLFEVLNNMDPNGISELKTQFNAMPDDKKLKAAQVIASGQGHSESSSPVTGEAIRYLVTNPVVETEGKNDSENDPLRLASEYASRLVTKDPTIATEWVRTLPDGDAKLWAQKNLAQNWAVYDPKAAGQWVKSLPPDARKAVGGFLKGKE